MGESEGDDIVEALLDVDDFEHEGRLFVAARIAPHPTAIRDVFEVVDEQELIHCTAEQLVHDTSDPYFWVWTYAGLLRAYLDEVQERIGLMIGPEIDAGATGPIGKAFDPDSAIGTAARQSIVGVRAHTLELATALLHAGAAPATHEEASELVDLFVDATFAATVLEQLSGQPAIPDDVQAAWEQAGDDAGSG
jgi:hypothetical protein